jgi:DNA polymerase III subunit gamma/tau
VKFILATTELHKIPETIVSRTQRYDFKRISESDIIERLRYIAHNENIAAEDEAMALIARLSR